MLIDKIRIGNHVPDDINVIIEIPMNHQYVKYEIDKQSGAVVVDRFLSVSMCYPCNYGFIPHTLAGDRDPLDVLVITNHVLLPGSVINTRPIGGLMMVDESGEDEKILAVPHSSIDPNYNHINDVNDLSADFKDRVCHFFKHYKDLDQNKWSKVHGFFNQAKAKTIIEQSI